MASNHAQEKVLLSFISYNIICQMSLKAQAHCYYG